MEELKWACAFKDLNHMFKKHREDAGYDICCATDITLPPFPARIEVSTGLHVEIPSGYDGKITARSGLAKKHGIYILGGEIDSNYRGEIIVIMGQLGSEPISFERGSRIAQLVVRSLYQGPIARVNFDQLSDTDRGAGGFGSTGGIG